MPLSKRQQTQLMKKRSQHREFTYGPIKREYLSPEIYKYAKKLRARSIKDFIERLDYSYMKKNKMLSEKLRFSKTLWEYGCQDLWIEKLKQTVKQLKDEIELRDFQIYFLRALIAKYRELTKDLLK